MRELPLHKPENNNLSLQQRIDLLKESLKEDAAIKLRAANYYLNTELYDLTLPGYFSPHNEWIPKWDYLMDSSRYARRERGHWMEGLSDAEIQKFQLYSQDYARFSVEELREEIEELNKILDT